MNKTQNSSGIWPKIGFASMVLAPLAFTAFSLYKFADWSNVSAGEDRIERQVVRDLGALDAELYTMWGKISLSPAASPLNEIRSYCGAVDVPDSSISDNVRNLCNTYKERVNQAGLVDNAGLAARKANAQETKYLLGGGLGILLAFIGGFCYLGTSDSARKDAEKAAIEHPRQHL